MPRCIEKDKGHLLICGCTGRGVMQNPCASVSVVGPSKAVADASRLPGLVPAPATSEPSTLGHLHEATAIMQQAYSLLIHWNTSKLPPRADWSET